MRTILDSRDPPTEFPIKKQTGLKGFDSYAAAHAADAIWDAGEILRPRQKAAILFSEAFARGTQGSLSSRSFCQSEVPGSSAGPPGFHRQARGRDHGKQSGAKPGKYGFAEYRAARSSFYELHRCGGNRRSLGRPWGRGRTAYLFSSPFGAFRCAEYGNGFALRKSAGGVAWTRHAQKRGHLEISMDGIARLNCNGAYQCVADQRSE